jgi:phage baseplate assembly protein V
MFDALLRMRLGPIVDMLLELETGIEDLRRRSDGFCRIGVCSAVDPATNTCNVSHGDLLTPAIKFFNPSAGEQSESRIPSVGEQCLLLNYGGGESGGQSVALFGLNTSQFPPASTVATLTRRTHKDGTESSYDDAAHVLSWKNGETAFKGSREGVELSVGAASFSMTPQAIELKLGEVGFLIDAAGFHFLGPLVDHQGRLISKV